MLKFLEDKKKETFHFLLLSSSICFFIKLSYIGVILLPILIIVIFYRKKFILVLNKQSKFFPANIIYIMVN